MKARLLGAPTALLMLTLMWSVESLADEATSRTVHIEVVGTPTFDVIYHRALTNNTGAVIGGLIGAGIQAGIESDKDATKRKELSPHVSEHIWDDAFVKTLNEAFLAKGFATVWGGKREKGEEKTDVYLVIYPDSYGFRIVDSDTALVAAYVEFKGIYAREEASAKKAAKENFYLASKKQASYDDLLKDPSVLNPDVETVLVQAARRLANKIIYNLK